MYCKHCGKEVENSARFCPHCGKDLANNDPFANYDRGVQTYQREEDKPNFGFAVLSFFFPLIGLILFLCWNTSYPLKAKSCGMGALIGFLTGIVLSVVIVVIAFVTLGNLIDESVWSAFMA